jgi:hypothetical protein
MTIRERQTQRGDVWHPFRSRRPEELACRAIAEQAVLLQADKFEGFGAYNYFDALEFFRSKTKQLNLRQVCRQTEVVSLILQ